MLADGDSATARRLLAPIAYSAHGVSGAEAARTFIDLIDGGKITEARAAMAKGKPDNDGGDSGGKGQPKS
jgi:hypothetical protein